MYQTSVHTRPPSIEKAPARQGAAGFQCEVWTLPKGSIDGSTGARLTRSVYVMGAITIEKGPRGEKAAGRQYRLQPSRDAAHLSAGGAVGSRARLFAALRHQGLGYSGLESVHSGPNPYPWSHAWIRAASVPCTGAAVFVCGFTRARSRLPMRDACTVVPARQARVRCRGRILEQH